MSLLSPWKVSAVTKVELGVKIRRLVSVTLSIPIPDVRIELLGHVGFAKRSSDRSEIVAFTTAEEGDLTGGER
ncbi:hypothetical protein [Amycolatopsis sp. FDAARGOS 1241]|uniref:hypothetical protein n=1 Tax=Amycolatopsis sp. FDAARGOS 1241 TaxID=2778070 RepID=UPI001951E375|nr:hypothetical protein [Amycolatopsis sp. FDAARGOS 1241]QRP42795.1 hypothetical protein I6J71_25320 [Amycolatopsis sp. FDAARGOS 1241]